ncbi:Hydroxysteroid dehydrogenase-like protein 2 [Nymphon striatum]|nr:Hydroxysteroid dehydrogenase-like protein 2 [Nymphon striatum]
MRQRTFQRCLHGSRQAGSPILTSPMMKPWRNSSSKERDMKFEGSSVVITGAGSGIGAAIARHAAAKGAKVCIGGMAVACDVRDEAQIKALIEQATKEQGEVDIYVSNAGLDAAQQASLLTADDVAQAVIDGVEAGRFLILSHPEVQTYALHRAKDHDRWVTGMQMLRAKAVETFGSVEVESFYKLM